jgi:spore germination protein GerM
VTAAKQQEAPGRNIKATLFYIGEDGLRLVAAEREVLFGEGPAEQGRRILEELLKPAAPPLASAIPQGTTLRALFVTARGDAFVDLGSNVARGHSGGSLDEIFTVYAIVNALTVNLPAVTSVQILVEGQEVDTLAGHVDLRRPLQKNLSWVAEPAPTTASARPEQP